MHNRLKFSTAFLAACLVAIAAGPPQPMTARAGYVHLQVRSANLEERPVVRVTFVESDSLQGSVRELPLPVDVNVPGLTVRVRVEPLVRTTVTTTVAEFWYGALPVTRGEVTGVGAELQVERGNLAIRTSPRHGSVVPLGPQP